MFHLMRNINFTETLCKDQYAGFFDDSLKIRDQSMSDSWNYSSYFYSVKHTCGPGEMIFLKLLEIYAMD